MTVSVFASGIATGTIGSEQFLTNVNQAGQFIGIIDLSNMANGDTLELRAYQTVLTGGTARVVDFQGFYGVQPTDQLIIQWGVGLGNELTDAQALRYSLKQTFGTARQYNWKVVNVENFPSNFTSLLINSVGQVATFSGTSTSVTNPVTLTNNQVVNFSGTITNVVNILNPVTVGTNNDKTGYSLSSPQSFNLIGNISGTYQGNINGTVQAVQGGTVTASGTVTATVASVPVVGIVTGSVGSVVGLTPSLLDVAVSSRMASGTVVVAGLTPSNLDVPVSSRLASGSYTTPPTTSQISTQVLSDASASPIASNIKKSQRCSNTWRWQCYSLGAVNGNSYWFSLGK